MIDEGKQQELAPSVFDDLASAAEQKRVDSRRAATMTAEELFSSAMVLSGSIFADSSVLLPFSAPKHHCLVTVVPDNLFDSEPTGAQLNSGILQQCKKLKVLVWTKVWMGTGRSRSLCWIEGTLSKQWPTGEFVRSDGTVDEEGLSKSWNAELAGSRKDDAGLQRGFKMDVLLCKDKYLSPESDFKKPFAKGLESQDLSTYQNWLLWVPSLSPSSSPSSASSSSSLLSSSSSSSAAEMPSYS